MMRSIAICGAPRTGGNWLCKMLEERGIGYGDEYASPAIKTTLMDKHGIDEGQYWNWIACNRRQSGVLVIKLHWSEVGYPWVEDPRYIFPPERITWVHQTRNYVAQAISWAQARRTGRWKGKTPEASATYREILEFTARAKAEYLGWSNWFHKADIMPLTIKYNDMLINPDGVCSKVITLAEESTNNTE